ncbi:PREDICTED: TNFAIP3-interacting protein 3 [Tinamus guttatus]|uniref:TNFAIP3-interacting protein 3 n=1 Tax=Tinamus guttatus TaxID=94827 RepID=UPI00052EB5D6|nr:PREDICTED: TNFAIP3-interacting protein 3 [Tinamus guttatus]
MERCESKELDVEIRNLIERTNTSQLCENPGPVTQECSNNQGTSCSLKLGERMLTVFFFFFFFFFLLQSKHVLLTKKKTTTADSVEQQILSLERQRRELLDVNKQWDHQFRSMKQHYEKKLVEMKAKLDMSQRRVSKLEEEMHQNRPENESWQFLDRDRPLQETKEIKILTGALHEMKEENKLLKEKNALMIKNKEHYECEISRLNKALLDMLKKQHSSALETLSAKFDKNNLEDMRTQLEVLRQQVQIYEEDFRKERSDRERLNEEKEALEKMNKGLQSQLNKLNSQIKACLKEKEQLERQLQQQTKALPPDYQWYVPDQFPPDVQHKANGTSSEKGAHP